MAIQFPSQERVAPPTLKPVDYAGAKDRVVPNAFTTIASEILGADKERRAQDIEDKKLGLEERRVKVAEDQNDILRENTDIEREKNKTTSEIKKITQEQKNANELLNLAKAKASTIQEFKLTNEELLTLKKSESVEEIANFQIIKAIDVENRRNAILKAVSSNDNEGLVKLLDSDISGDFDPDAGSALEKISTENRNAYEIIKKRLSDIPQNPKYVNNTIGVAAKSLYEAFDANDRIAVQQMIAMQKAQAQAQNADNGVGYFLGTSNEEDPSSKKIKIARPTDTRKNSSMGKNPYNFNN